MKLKIISILLIGNSALSWGQVFPAISFKGGLVVAGQQKTSTFFGEENIIFCLSASVEPTIYRFGNAKQFDLNLDISVLGKGSKNVSAISTYSETTFSTSTGYQSYRQQMTYVSFSPLLKARLGHTFYLKAGPRVDILADDRNSAFYPQYIRTEIEPYTFGITYGIGIVKGKKQTQFICEVVGQSDLSSSAYNRTTNQKYKNHAAVINLGLLYTFKPEQKN
ncbi:MAG: hypothetical protein H0X46_02440 [Bacteroidetes bacterium]|nr:hypothetical protein [Bacteroidota bacterium]